MGIVDQAVKRLEELRRAGVDVPWTGSSPPAEGRTDVRPAAPKDLKRALPASVATPQDAAPVTRLMDPLAGQSRLPADDTGAESRLVELDLDAIASAGYIDPRVNSSPIADQYRLVKRPILANTRVLGEQLQSRTNLVMVTSSIPGEGKTFTALNLAMSIAAEIDKTVLLVDADPARPTLMNRLGVPDGPGLLDKLAHPSRPLSELILRTNVEKLALLPIGKRSGKTNELFASLVLEELLMEMSQRYPDRVILFDGPPLLPSPEARVLASCVGQVVLVIEAGRTPRAVVDQSLAVLEACPTVLALLNKQRIGTTIYGYDAYGY